ncbi:MAG: hypothetical protein ABIT10_14060 [Alteraurantiacibacter sp.]
MGARVQGHDEGGNKVASLEPYLLARKGGARPAMRSSQQLGGTAEAIDDLGWNDIGDGRPAPVTEVPEPEVKRQQSRLLSCIADANRAVLERADAEAERSARRAAFTLRLDEGRHLRLRLASTVAGESAQNLVTRALDEFLARHPDIEHLAAQVRNRGPHGSGQLA